MFLVGIKSNESPGLHDIDVTALHSRGEMRVKKEEKNFWKVK